MGPEPLMAANIESADANGAPIDLDCMPLVLQDLIRSYLPRTVDIGTQAERVDSFFVEDAQSRTRKKTFIRRLVLVLAVCVHFVVFVVPSWRSSIDQTQRRLHAPCIAPSSFRWFAASGQRRWSV